MDVEAHVPGLVAEPAGAVVGCLLTMRPRWLLVRTLIVRGLHASSLPAMNPVSAERMFPSGHPQLERISPAGLTPLHPLPVTALHHQRHAEYSRHRRHALYRAARLPTARADLV
jgi:hypothetical protein